MHVIQTLDIMLKYVFPSSFFLLPKCKHYLILKNCFEILVSRENLLDKLIEAYICIVSLI